MSSSSSPHLLPITAESSKVEIYSMCLSYPQLYAHRHIAPVAKLISCISSYAHNHRSASIDSAFTAHRNLTLSRGRRRRVRVAQAEVAASDAALAQIAQLRDQVDRLDNSLQRARAERDELRDELAGTARSEVEARQQLHQLLQQRDASIAGAPPAVDCMQRRLTSYMKRQRTDSATL